MDKRGDHFRGIKATLEKVTEKVGVDRNAYMGASILGTASLVFACKKVF